MTAMTECTICGRPATKTSDYCMYHKKAHENLTSAYREWRERMAIDWDSFLNQMDKLDDLGQWVREVVDHLMS